MKPPPTPRNQPVVDGIEVSTSFKLQAGASLESSSDGVFCYRRQDSPSFQQLEYELGKLEDGYAVCYSSGLGALWASLVFYRPRRILLRHGYHGSARSIELYQNVSGCKVEFIPIKDVKLSSARPFVPGDLVLLETPLNATGEVYDISMAAELIHKTNGVHLLVDGTLAPAPLQSALKCQADMLMLSTTKYHGGHSDLLGGALVCQREADSQELRRQRMHLGSNMGSMECFLLQSLTAKLLVEYLTLLPECSPERGEDWEAVERAARLQSKLPPWAPPHIRKVHHASLPEHLGHDVAVGGQMKGGFSAVIALELTSKEKALQLTQRVRVFQFATSLGSVESLIDYRHAYDSSVSPCLVRLSIGLEPLQDLCWDIYHALC